MKFQRRFAIVLVALAALLFSTLALSACSDCEHEWSEWTVTKEATCFSEGKAVRVCALDGTHIETKVLEKTAHKWGEYVSDGMATCTTNGHKTAVCMNIGCSEKNVVLDPIKDHAFTTYTTVEATCGMGKHKIATCDIDGCGAVDIQMLSEAPGHSYGTDSICTVCGEPEPYFAVHDVSANGDKSVLAYIYDTGVFFPASRVKTKYTMKIVGTGEMADFAKDETP